MMKVALLALGAMAAFSAVDAAQTVCLEESNGRRFVGVTHVPRGRPRLNASRTTFVTDRGTALRGCSYVPNREGLEKIKELGLNAVHEYAEGCSLNYPAEGARAPGYNVEKIDAAVRLTKELGLYYVMTIGNDPGRFNRQWALDFWKFYAPRYANEPHVIYEIHNEPVKWSPPYASATADPPGAVEMNAACWKLIREMAPKSPILIFSYSQLPWDSGAHILGDVKKFNECVGRDEKSVWSNTAIAFHGYAGSGPTETPVKDVLAAGYPMFMTEYYSTPWGGDAALGRNDCELTGFLEERNVSWLSFLYVPPAPWNLDVTDDRRFKTPTELAGIVWKPDFGAWPKPRRLITDGGCAFEVGTWQDKRIKGGVVLKPTGAASDEFVLRVREAGYYDLGVVCGAGGAGVTLELKGERLMSLTVPTAGGRVGERVFLEPGRGVLRLARTGQAKVLKLEISPVAEGPFADGLHRMTNRASGLALAAYGSVYQDAFALDDKHRWEFLNLGAGQYRILTKNGNGVLNRIFFGSDKVNVVWYGWESPSADQRWIFRPGSDGRYRLAPVATGYDVLMPSKNPNEKLTQGKAPWAGEAAAEWTVERL